MSQTRTILSLGSGIHILQVMVCDLALTQCHTNFAVPADSVPPERVFSRVGEVPNQSEIGFVKGLIVLFLA